MSAGPGQEPDYLDETHQRIAEFAAEFIEDEDERGDFVDQLMERRGYQRIASWASPEPQGQGQGQGGQPRLLKPAKTQGRGGQQPRGGQQQQGQGQGQGGGYWTRGGRGGR